MRGLAAFSLCVVALVACVGDGTAEIADPTPDAGNAPVDSGAEATTTPPAGDDDDGGTLVDAAPEAAPPVVDSGTCGAGSQTCITTFTTQVTAKCQATEQFCISNCALADQPAVCKQKCQATFQACEQTAEDTCTNCEATSHDCAPRADCHAHAVAP